MKDRTEIISCKDKEILFSDKTLVGRYWSDCKKLNRCEKAPYDILLENLILKNDYEKYKVNKNKNIKIKNEN
jgi:hypothetical protein